MSADFVFFLFNIYISVFFSYSLAHREEQWKIFPDFRNIPQYLEESFIIIVVLYYNNNVIMWTVDNKT